MSNRVVLMSAAAAAAVLLVVGCQCGGGPMPCPSSGECGAAQVCLQTQTCAQRCSTDSQCLPNEKCSTGGGCVAKSGCGADGDCGANKVCALSGSCVDHCLTSGCPTGQKCTSTGHCISNSADGGAQSCGGELFQASRVQANILVAFDKSGSMSETINGRSKWAIGTEAIKQLTAQHQANIRFGLLLFPGTSECSVPPVSVRVADQQASAIAQALDGSGPSGKTPIGAVLAAAANVPELADPNRANYVMLVTDGKETCNGNGVNSTRALFAKGIKTYVVGFGSGVDPANLSSMAVEGGTARAGTPKYYQADDQAALSAAFNAIAQGALGCDFRLAKAPPDPSKIFVYVNGTLAPRDPNRVNGWEYTPSTQRITLYGPVCDVVSKDPSAKVSIVYGCPDDSIVEGDRPKGGLPGGSVCSTSSQCASQTCVNGFCEGGGSQDGGGFPPIN